MVAPTKGLAKADADAKGLVEVRGLWICSAWMVVAVGSNALAVPVPTSASELGAAVAEASTPEETAAAFLGAATLYAANQQASKDALDQLMVTKTWPRENLALAAALQ